MNGRMHVGIILLGVAVIGFVVWQWRADIGGNSYILFNEYPGFVNSEELNDDPRAVAQWELQRNMTEAVLEQNPGDLDTMESLAFYDYLLGDYAKGRRLIEAVIEKNSINFATWVLLGDISNKMEDYKTAEAAYVKSLTLGTDTAVFQKLESLWRREFPERDADIEDLYLQAIAVSGQDSFYLSRLVNWYVEHERWDEAASHLKVLVDLHPDDEVLRRQYEDYSKR